MLILLAYALPFPIIFEDEDFLVGVCYATSISLIRFSHTNLFQSLARLRSVST